MKAYSYTSHLSHKALRYLQYNKNYILFIPNFSCITSNFGCRFYQYVTKLCVQHFINLSTYLYHMKVYSYTSHLKHKALRYLQHNKNYILFILNFSCITSNFGCLFYQYFTKSCVQQFIYLDSYLYHMKANTVTVTPLI